MAEDVENLKAGDVVQLKSGGPPMIIDSLSKDEDGGLRVRCVWFDENKPQSEVYAMTSLKKKQEA